MSSESARQDRPEEEETARERRVKLLLLVVALVLAAGYAATFADLGGAAGEYLAGAVRSLSAFQPPATIPLLPLAAVGAALIVALLLLHRRRGGRVGGTASGIAPEALATPAGRQAFAGTLARQFAAHSEAGRQFAIHIIDLDRFAAVNEMLGEAAGDALLGKVADRLLALVENPDRLARLGDDEFGVIQPEAGGARHAEIYARRIQDTLGEACSELPHHIRPGASIGVAVAPEHGADPAGLLHNASLALRVAKQAGGGCFKVYGREMAMSAQARRQMEQAIDTALRQGWFELHFQPQYDLRSRRLTGFEALIRMNHPELGELQPNAFLPAAEESGLIQPLGEWIIGEALATAAHWPAHVTLSVNLSTAQFRGGDVAAIVLAALRASGFDAARLRAEISEAVLLDDAASVQDQLKRLKACGVTIVLDDFGLNSSNLQALARSPCDAVKLDRSFIDGVGEEAEVERLVRGLIGTAQSFHLAMCAEGIERPEQARFLLSNDCGNVQGFLFGRPAPARDLGAIIAKDMRKQVAGDRSEPPTATSAPLARQA